MTKIMIVEDNDDVRYAIRESLSSTDPDYKVVDVETGEECLSSLSDENPDLILMDIMMPGTDGMQTAIMIRDNPDYEHIKIVFLTAKTDSLTKGLGSLNGEYFIEKPFDPSDLSKKVKAALNSEIIRDDEDKDDDRVFHDELNKI